MSNEINLHQRGRAMMDFEVSARQKCTAINRVVERELADQGITAEILPDDMDARHAMIDAALADSVAYRWKHMLGDYCSAQHGQAAIAAFEEARADLMPLIAQQNEGPVTIDYRPGFVAPAYFARTWFHRTEGGWDGHPQNGFIHGEIVHKKYVSRVFPGDIYANRRAVARLVPRSDYNDILELGTSSGHYTVALSEVFPNACITGMDPSPRMLEQAARVGNALGKDWHLIVGIGEDTGLPDESFDLVTSYAVHHEIPPKAIEAMFAEAYRLLRPGGTVLMADVGRYRDLDKLTAWRFDWTARYGGEPFWRATATLDFVPLAEKAGFADITAGAVKNGDTYYYIVGSKPA